MLEASSGGEREGRREGDDADDGDVTVGNVGECVDVGRGMDGGDELV